MNRRDFLKRIVKSFFTLAGIGLALLSTSIYPSKTAKKEIRYVPVSAEEELPRRGVKRIDFSYEGGGRTLHAKAFLVATTAGLIALSPVCSHLGCLVNWDARKGEFLCPCHGGRYDMDGAVRAGPPPAPLTRLPIEVRGGKVYIGVKV